MKSKAGNFVERKKGVYSKNRYLKAVGNAAEIKQPDYRGSSI